MILTLLLIAVMTLTTVELLEFIRPRRELSRELLERKTLLSAADTGVEFARQLLSGRLDDEAGADTAIDHLESSWAEEIVFFLDDIEVTVIIEDEERRLPLSFLAEPGSEGEDRRESGTDPGGTGGEDDRPPGAERDGEAEPPDAVRISEAGFRVFRELLRALELPEQWRNEAADSLADWIEAPEFTRRGAGAGRTYYLAEGYEPRGGVPRTLGELRMIRGFGEQVSGPLFPCLSPFSGHVNLNTVRPEVLRALARPGERLGVDSIISARPYESLADVNRKTGRDLNAMIVPEFSGRLLLSSAHFAVRSVARDTAGRSHSIYAVLKRDEEKSETVYWLPAPFRLTGPADHPAD